MIRPMLDLTKITQLLNAQPTILPFHRRGGEGRGEGAKVLLALATAAALFAAGCASEPHDQGPYVPTHEATEPVVLMDPGVHYSVTLGGPPLARTLEDGRTEVTVQFRNRENRRIEVQANCVFKDINGLSTGDETPFQTVILTENATEQVKFVSINDLAKRYTIRVRQAR